MFKYLRKFFHPFRDYLFTDTFNTRRKLHSFADIIEDRSMELRWLQSKFPRVLDPVDARQQFRSATITDGLLI